MIKEVAGFLILVGVPFMIVSNVVDDFNSQKKHNEIKNEIKNLSNKVDSLIKLTGKK